MLNDYFEKKFQENVMKHPTFQTYLGMKSNYDKLNDFSQEFYDKEFEETKKTLKEIEKFEDLEVDAQTKISFKLFKQSLEDEIADYKWRYHSYPVNQMFGFQSSLPAFMINMHTISSPQEARAYISRIKEFQRVFDEMMIYMDKQAQLGIIPPNFVFSKVLTDAQNVIKGKPFQRKGKDSALWEDFKKKVDALKISGKQKQRLKMQAEIALNSFLKPSYEKLIAFVKELDKKTDKNHGVWALPDGADYYNVKLKRITSTDLTAEEIHKTGVLEVARIHKEMRGIMKQTGFKGSLQGFFKFMQDDPRFKYPNTKKGREKYLKDAKAIIATMKKTLPKMFNVFPKAKLEVVPVEKFREKSAGIAFYNGPSLVGDRPGRYYVNLYKMEDVAKYEMEALAYHEALPGHHMQIAIASELEGLPTFRKMGGYTAYVEGWGLYSELLPKEFGFYKDPYSDFGRLSMELWRACRLVVDTGIHFYKWSREKSIDYLTKNTPNGKLEIVKGVERYFVMPGQATAYKVGMMKILDIRAAAKKRLGAKFDLKEFHDVVLKNGALPLAILESNVKRWVDSKI